MIWSRLEESYGSPEAIESALFSKIENFPRISNKENHKLRELGDLLFELQAAKEDGYLPGLTFLDTARGVGPIVDKLPFHLQEKWMSVGSRYKEEHGVAFPPFSIFSQFIQREAKSRNDPSFNTTVSTTPLIKERPVGKPICKYPVTVHKTSVSIETANNAETSSEDPGKICPIHKKPHALGKCKSFRAMLLEDRKKLLKENGICFRCCASTSHQAKNCEIVVKCAECESERHLTALHPGHAPHLPKPSGPYKEHGGEQVTSFAHLSNQVAQPMCTQVCGDSFSRKSCSKICLINVYPCDRREESKRMYAILDDQSNVSLARTEFFDVFNVQGMPAPYVLRTCAGVVDVSGKRAQGFIVESLDGKTSIPLPTLTECNQLPNNREEIPTPEAAYHHSHMRAIANELPALDDNADILLLLGRDILQVHKVREQFNGPYDAPYAQKLDLGWVIVGDVCLGGAHKKKEVSTLKTCILENGRPSHLTPCESLVRVKENFNLGCPQVTPDWSHMLNPKNREAEERFGQTVFQRTENDYQLAPSSEPTIPRLELCAAVLAVEVAEFVKEEIGQKLDKVTLYTDSKVVLGYICNDSQRFYVYVHNRVQRIRQSTCPSQWKYVATDNNPADHGTRSVSAGQLQSVNWLSGPSFLLEPENSTSDNNPQFEVVDPDSDVEIRPIVTACSTKVSVKELGTKRFERFSSWSSLTKSTARLCHIAQGFSKQSDNPSCRGRHICPTGPTIAEIKKAEHIIIKSVFSPT